jgi:hypothetical protein
LPAEVLEISHTSGVEDNTFLFEQLLLVSARTDFALGVDHTLPGDRWSWMVITQGCHSLTDLLGCYGCSDHQRDLPIGSDLSRGNVPDDFIDPGVQCIGHRVHSHTRQKAQS